MRLRLAALDDVTDLHKEVTQEHGMPPFGTQNQPMDFILGHFYFGRSGIAPRTDRWADGADIDQMTTVLRRPAARRALSCPQLPRTDHAATGLSGRKELSR
jgi:hypothetical protein